MTIKSGRSCLAAIVDGLAIEQVEHLRRDPAELVIGDEQTEQDRRHDGHADREAAEAEFVRRTFRLTRNVLTTTSWVVRTQIGRAHV